MVEHGVPFLLYILKIKAKGPMPFFLNSTDSR